MRHPFEVVTPEKRKRIFWLTLAASLVLLLVFNTTGAPLITSAAPMGIVSFELAGAPERAQAMLNAWDMSARLIAAFGLGIDYLFMVTYSMSISMAGLMAAEALRRCNWPLAQLGGPLAWGQLLAALLDAVENVALMVILLGGATSPWSWIAYWCASVKFILIFLGLVYAFFGLCAFLNSMTKRVV